MTTNEDEDAYDVLESSLHILGASPIQESSAVSFGSITVTRPPRAGKANTLLADQVFNPGLVTAEQIESGRIDVAGQCVLELGCGAGLPSLVAASQDIYDAPELVVLTDYPDDAIIANLSANVERNAGAFRCRVEQSGYEWGTDHHGLLAMLPLDKSGFDVLIMSDLIHLTPPIAPLLTSLTSLLSFYPSSRAYISVGSYTPSATVQRFIEASKQVGLLWEEWDLESQGRWDGPFVSGLGGVTEGSDWLLQMKKSVRGWSVRWATPN